MNCLSFALMFWEKDNDYRIWYNSCHCINLPNGSSAVGFLMAETFGYEHFLNTFNDTLSEEDKRRLKKYFRK